MLHVSHKLHKIHPPLNESHAAYKSKTISLIFFFKKTTKKGLWAVGEGLIICPPYHLKEYIYIYHIRTNV